jgi:hypothetical protein
MDSAEPEGETDSSPTEGELLQLCSTIPGYKNIWMGEVNCCDMCKMNDGSKF